MSEDPEDPILPRRSRPAPKRSTQPPAEPEEPTTFRPTPRKAARSSVPPPADSGKKTTTTRFPARDPDEPIRIPKRAGMGERIVFGGVGSGQLSAFCRQAASYLDAGVDLRKALVSLERQYARTALGPVIGRMLVGVKHGDALAETVAREPQAFDALFVAMVKVAEARGGLPETFKMLARHYEARQNLIRQARSAMIYPIAVLVIASAVIALLTLWLLPMFLSLLQELMGRGAQLPLPSRVLMSFSQFVQSLGWWLMPLCLIGTPLCFLQAYKTSPGKQLMDRIALRIPVLGKLLGKIETTRFARTLSTLLGSGVAVGTSLDLTADVMQLDPFRSAVQGTKQSVMDGEFLSEALSASRRFATDVISIIESGEETGKVPEALEHLANDYEEQVAYMVKNMGQLIQPLIMIMLGGVVLFIILAVLLPYISAITSLAGGGP